MQLPKPTPVGQPEQADTGHGVPVTWASLPWAGDP